MVKKLAWQMGVIIIGLAVGIGIQFAGAWVNPPPTPPGTNVGAPITTGAAAQVKYGGLGVNGVLTAFSKLIVGNDLTPEGNLLLDVEGRVGATEYCDQNGQNCKTITSMGGSTNLDWNSITNKPAGFADDTDDGLTSCRLECTTGVYCSDMGYVYVAPVGCTDTNGCLNACCRILCS